MSTSAEIIAADADRRKALMAGDHEAIEQLLDPLLHFSHAAGHVDTKRQYLDKFAAGRVQYLAAEVREPHVIDLGATALLTGLSVTRVRVGDEEMELHNRILTVWARHGERWRLVAFQPTPIST